MDLQWQRQTELWLRLMGATHQPAALRLALPLAIETIYLEQSHGRARVSLCRLLHRQDSQATLLRLLSLLQPDAGGGIPLRAWLSGTSVWLSALAPPDSGAELWAELIRRQRLLLDRTLDQCVPKGITQGEINPIRDSTKRAPSSGLDLIPPPPPYLQDNY